MSLYDEYEHYTNLYKKEYGDQSIVLYMCGSFYEIYGLDPEYIYIKKICELLNIQLSKRNKAIPEVSRSNSYMAGFPVHSLHRFVPVLTAAGYTVILIDQVTPPPNPKRQKTHVYSAGTYIDASLQPDNNYLMIVVLIQKIYGLSMIDLSTGECKTTETPESHEIARIIKQYSPSELVLLGDFTSAETTSGTATDNTNMNIFEHAQNVKKLTLNKPILDINYQIQLLEKVYEKQNMLSILEYLDLERLPTATISFVAMLQFSYQHDEQILTKISKPRIITKKNVISNITHLNIPELLKIINNCSTAIGRRKFKDWCLNSITNTYELNKRYDQVGYYLEDQRYKQIYKQFENVYDLERLYRRICLKKILPTEFSSIISTLDCIPADIINLTELKNLIIKTINYNDPVLYINTECPNIKTLNTKIQELKNFFITLATMIHPEFVKISDNNELLITAKRFKELNLPKNLICAGINIKTDEFIIKTTSTNLKITHPSFVNINDNITEHSIDLDRLVKREYNQFLLDLTKYQVLFESCCRYIGETDVYATYARNAFEFNYTKPILCLDKLEKSFVRADALRHPIIERILTKELFTPNNLEDNQMLLYGTNAVGKTSYIKSIALAVLMAQAGMYVPASKFEFYPYRYIQSRIPSGDDLMNGHSTFTVEMRELRYILSCAGPHSLVIGDEVASGTESISALSIVAASLKLLVEAGATFVFATHLHDLVNLIPKEVKVAHMEVIYDLKLKSLIYDRKIKDGQGSTVYGLEVCKGLDMSTEFMEIANNIRQDILKIEKQIVSPKKSRYNRKVYVDICTICKAKAEEVHHMKPQMLADANGNIGHFKKNTKANLLPICTKCHDNLHNKNTSNSTTIEYKQTTSGVVVV